MMEGAVQIPRKFSSGSARLNFIDPTGARLFKAFDVYLRVQSKQSF